MGVYINEIEIENFKSIKKEKIQFRIPGESESGLNIFVGENNAGKSSFIEAIIFLFEGSRKDISILKNKDAKTEEKLSVKLTFSGNLSELISNFCQENKKKVFEKYIFKKENKEFLTIQRSEEDPKSIFMYNSSSDEFKNESGIDAPFKKLFAIESIEVDKNPDDEIKYSASSTIKKILEIITEEFEEKKEYQDYQEAYEKTFNAPESELRKEISKIEKNIGEILKKQFGDLEIKFNFDKFDKEAFFKNSTLSVKDKFLEKWVSFEEKGEGTQRAISLSLVQLYSEFLKSNPDLPDKHKPFYLFIDEPELSLHPEAQKKLLEALKEICKKEQIFLSTHSPYFLAPNLFRNVYKFINSKENGTKIYYDKENKLKSLSENRKFFFHHRDILFREKVLFVEGVEDLERYSKYLSKNNLDFYISNIYMLGGKGDFDSSIKSFCKTFNISCLCIKDLDHLISLIKTQTQLPARDEASLSQKEWIRNIFAQIDFEDKNLCNTVENELKSNCVLVNPYIDVKDYIDLEGNLSEDKWNFLDNLFKFLEIVKKE